MSLTSDERKSVVEFRVEKARRALEQAQGVVELQYWETIANRLYYAAYNAVSAMLIAYGYMAQIEKVITIATKKINESE